MRAPSMPPRGHGIDRRTERGTGPTRNVRPSRAGAPLSDQRAAAAAPIPRFTVFKFCRTLLVRTVTHPPLRERVAAARAELLANASEPDAPAANADSCAPERNCVNPSSDSQGHRSGAAMGDRISVLVVDDHPIVREGLISLLSREDDIVVAAQARNGDEAVELFRTHQPDVTLLDLGLPGIDGVEVIRRVRRDYPDARIVVFSTLEGDDYIRRALDAGACSYVLKDMRGPEVLNAVRRAATGGKRLPEAVSTRLSEAGPAANLSPRELDVLKLIAEGLSNRGIGERLGIGEGTVKTHVIQILEKLGTADRTGAVVQAIRRGIIAVAR